MNHQNQQTGMTIIELIMSLSIVAIGLGASLPSFSNLLKNQTLTTENNRLVSALNLARNQAISHNKIVIICASRSGSDCDAGRSWNQGWIVFTDENFNRVRDADETVTRVAQASQTGVSIISPAARQILRFFPDGSSPGSNATLTFCDERGAESARSIIISNVGRVRQSHSRPDGSSLICP